MGHTKPEALGDIAAEIATIRALEGLKEKGFAVFYLKSVPFLHFHDKDGRRWAHIKGPDGWKQLDIPFGAKAGAKAAFLKSVGRARDALAEAGKKCVKPKR